MIPPTYRLLDALPETKDELKRLCRISVVMAVANGLTEDEIYRTRIDTAIKAVRLEGCDEDDVEVIAALTRRNVADALAECWEAGWI